MSIKRFANWAYPSDLGSLENIGEFLRRHYIQHTEESVDRIKDFKVFWDMVEGPVVNVQNYGAIGDDDVSTGIQAAINATEVSGGIVFFPPGTYRIDVPLTVDSSKVHLIGSGSESTIIDIRNLVGFSGISFSGTISTATTLAANADENDISVTTSSATGWSVDDLVFIQSTTTFGDTTGTCGEIVKIASISGTTITFYTRLFDAYTTAATAGVKKITPVKGVKCQGFQILGDEGGDNGLEFKYVENGIIDDVKCIRTDYSGLEIETSYNVNITNYKSLDVCAAGTGYGISIHTGCRDIFIDGAHIEESRHAISIGGTTPCRSIQVNNSFLHSKWNDNLAFDVHLGDELSVNNCQIIGGTNTGDCHIVFRGCDFYSNGKKRTITNRAFTHFHHVTMIGCRVFQYPDAVNALETAVYLTVTTGTSNLKMYDCEVQCFDIVPSAACISCFYDNVIIENCVVSSEIANATAIYASSNVSTLKVRGNDLSGCTTRYNVNSATSFDFTTDGIQLTIADNDFTSFSPGQTIGMIYVYGTNAAYDEVVIMASYRAADSHFCRKITGWSDFDVTVGVLDGTTGADGNVTVSANSADNKIYIENRFGAEITIGVILSGY